jgi:glycine C-acetyltransferase/8-amino-7-oxononanoate synthase
MDFITKEIENLKERGLFRTLKTVEGNKGSKITIDGKEYLLFCSNNYLGLSDHPKVVERALEAVKEFGFGSGASRLISGNSKLHEELEGKIARLKKREASIVFPTGYMANVGTISALTDENDTIIIDRLNHASIIDACKLSKAKLQVYPHKDMQALQKILKKSEKFKKRLIVTDSVFSMDGDIAPLPAIVKLGRKYDAITMIDEAHATGTLGKAGHGAEEHFEIEGQVDIVMGTLSKALGSLGGFIAGSKQLIEYLRNKSGSFIYTTALPPSACAAALAAIEIVEDEPKLIERLWGNVSYLKSKLEELKLNYMDSETQIIPLLIGDQKKTMKLSELLLEKGILASGIRPPTVPKDQCRIRITVMATHTRDDIDKLIGVLSSWAKRSS